MSHAKREAFVVGGSARHIRRYARMTRWRELQDIAMLSAVQTCDHMSLHMSINSITTFDMFALEKSAVVMSSCHSLQSPTRVSVEVSLPVGRSQTSKNQKTPFQP